MNQNNYTCKNVGPWKSRGAGRSLGAGNRCLDHLKAVQGCLQSLQFANFADFRWFCWLPSLGESPGYGMDTFHGNSKFGSVQDSECPPGAFLSLFGPISSQ